ncbi:dimeric dihydrodiol dehydrogenase, putative [Rhizoctonia solani AG-3 Rhs1AP]|uniref:D-xylose 1-dehydrogenase (NADP(+), D-xylono-1,5-lactone-forming) n=2 Tax=Rhizoctonia solani AG-3 TaxID=1086053 RepID=A0A074RP34_9AGAM|nr:dimeric dihydrodiol dehydrogenase, putative [Rhizoctonia solani AG-3 Rhs1AP]KEP47110.1 putative dimeric dihydrodiol dehydrogenase [Rhizoctonia solani 123E]
MDSIIQKEFIVIDDRRQPECHASTLVVVRDHVLAAWFGGEKEGLPDVKIWLSKRSRSGEWSQPRVVAVEDGVTHWSPVLFTPDPIKAPDRVILFYKTGTPIPRWKTWKIESTDGGVTWSPRQELVSGDESGGRGPVKNPVLANGDWASGASVEVTLPNGKGVWDSFCDISPAGPEQGTLWIRSPLIPLDRESFKGEGIIQPSLWESTIVTENGTTTTLHMLTRSSNGWVCRSDSFDNGRSWSPAYSTVLPNNNSGLCVTKMRDDRLVCIHNPVGGSWGARTPLVASISADNGMTWERWAVLDDQAPPEGFAGISAVETGIVSDGRSEFSYPTVVPTPLTEPIGVLCTWTWQRRGVSFAKIFDSKVGSNGAGKKFRSTVEPTRWGILGCGGISSKFVKDLLIDPSTRGVVDVSHVITAVASRSLLRGQEWIKETCPDNASAIEVYGTYEELLEDPHVDIIYIGTPHSHHFQNAKSCLNARKHVLCEKAFTVNAAQARALKALAKSKNLFLMEGMWTRFFPLVKSVQQELASGVIGDVKRVYADFGEPYAHPIASLPPTHRMLSPALAGGTLHDLFPYPLFWALITLYHLPANERTPPSQIAASSILHPNTGVDIQTTAILNFAKIGAQAILSSSLEVPTPRDQVVLIQGTKGDLVIPLIPPGRPTKYYIRLRSEEKRNANYDESARTFDIPGHGLFWEADECARCLARGEIESSSMPLDESIFAMDILDEIRRQTGIKFPAEIESATWAD